jgi:hypothetical protein
MEMKIGEALPPVRRAKIKVLSHTRIPPGIGDARNPGKSKDQKTEPPAVIIPEKYKDPDKSGLLYEVKSGPQQHNIELRD